MSRAPTAPTESADVNNLSALAVQAALLAERLAVLATDQLSDVDPVGLPSTDAKRAGAVRRYVRGCKTPIGPLPDELFANPSWNILLELFAARVEGHPVSVSAACAAAGGAPTTAARWVNCLVELECIERMPDPANRGEHLLSISQTVFDDIANWVDRALLRSQ